MNVDNDFKLKEHFVNTCSLNLTEKHSGQIHTLIYTVPTASQLHKYYNTVTHTTTTTRTDTSMPRARSPRNNKTGKK